MKAKSTYIMNVQAVKCTTTSCNGGLQWISLTYCLSLLQPHTMDHTFSSTSPNKTRKMGVWIRDAVTGKRRLLIREIPLGGGGQPPQTQKLHQQATTEKKRKASGSSKANKSSKSKKVKLKAPAQPSSSHSFPSSRLSDS